MEQINFYKENKTGFYVKLFFWCLFLIFIIFKTTTITIESGNFIDGIKDISERILFFSTKFIDFSNTIPNIMNFDLFHKIEFGFELYSYLFIFIIWILFIYKVLTGNKAIKILLAIMIFYFIQIILIITFKDTNSIDLKTILQTPLEAFKIFFVNIYNLFV
jgi:hypothetical protein